MFFAFIEGVDYLIVNTTLEGLKDNIINIDSDFDNPEYFKKNVMIIEGEKYNYKINKTDWQLE